MTSVVVYKRQSNIDIIPENDYYTELSKKEGNFNFFDLPEPICVEVMARLSLRDTRAMALTCRAAWHITRDQFMWKRKLWLRAKTLNLGLSGPNFIPDPLAGMLVRDPLLVNSKLLYEILDIDSCIGESQEDLDMGNLLSKMAAPNNSTSLSDIIDHFFSIFQGSSQQAVPHPFSRGEGAPTYLLFGMPESKVSKKLVLRFIASKDSTFDTVGFVKGKPGGVGGGVTVKYTHHLLNFLPVRRARPRLLVDSPAGTIFHPDVAEVIPQVDGLICYMDAMCTCPTNSSCSHTMDVLELEAMLRTIQPHLAPPMLVLLARQAHPQSSPSDTDHDVDSYATNSNNPSQNCTHSDKPTSDGSSSPTHSDKATSAGVSCLTSEPPVLSATRHRPAMLHSILESIDLPWAVCEVEVKTLSGVHQGLNWLLHRTLMLKNG